MGWGERRTSIAVVVRSCKCGNVAVGARGGLARPTTY